MDQLCWALQRSAKSWVQNHWGAGAFSMRADPLPETFHPSQDPAQTFCFFIPWLGISRHCVKAPSEGGKEGRELTHTLYSWSLHQQSTLVSKTWTQIEIQTWVPDLRPSNLVTYVTACKTSWVAQIFQSPPNSNILILSMLIMNS